MRLSESSLTANHFRVFCDKSTLTGLAIAVLKGYNFYPQRASGGMADAQDSGSCARKGVEVQVLSRAVMEISESFSFRGFFLIFNYHHQKPYLTNLPNPAPAYTFRYSHSRSAAILRADDPNITPRRFRRDRANTALR